jgi:hypothetical protein
LIRKSFVCGILKCDVVNRQVNEASHFFAGESETKHNEIERSNWTRS